MKVEYKYKVGQEVFFMHENRIYLRRVIKVFISIGKGVDFNVLSTVKYVINDGYLNNKSDSISRDESDLFSSKEELIKSL